MIPILDEFLDLDTNLLLKMVVISWISNPKCSVQSQVS